VTSIIVSTVQCGVVDVGGAAFDSRRLVAAAGSLPDDPDAPVIFQSNKTGNVCVRARYKGSFISVLSRLLSYSDSYEKGFRASEYSSYCCLTAIGSHEKRVGEAPASSRAHNLIEW
jgi:hypothetical protein